MNKKFPTLAIAVAAFCLASCHCDDDTPTTSKYIALESGKYTTVNLIVGRNEVTLGSVSINNWLEGSSINGGEAQTDNQ